MVFRIYGMPPAVADKLDGLVGLINLEISKYHPTNQNYFFFPSDLFQEGLGEEIVVFVEYGSNSQIDGDLMRSVGKAVEQALENFAKANVPQCKVVKIIFQISFHSTEKVIG